MNKKLLLSLAACMSVAVIGVTYSKLAEVKGNVTYRKFVRQFNEYKKLSDKTEDDAKMLLSSLNHLGKYRLRGFRASDDLVKGLIADGDTNLQKHYGTVVAVKKTAPKVSVEEKVDSTGELPSLEKEKSRKEIEGRLRTSLNNLNNIDDDVDFDREKNNFAKELKAYADNYTDKQGKDFVGDMNDALGKL